MPAETAVAPEASDRIRRYGAYALVVLFGLNFVDEFDRVAFNALAPEIRDALGVGDATIVTVATLAGAISVLLAIPIGYLADRFSRVSISVAAALLWIASALGTGLANGVLLLAAARFFGGAGRLVNDAVHPSLLSAYYPPPLLPTVNAVHRAANPIGAILAGPVVGLLAAAFGFRSTFLVLSIPTVILVVLALRLRDPRGRGAAKTESPPPGTATFREAFRALRKTRTLPRIWLVASLYAAGAFPFLTVLSLFFEASYDIGPGGRGWIQGLFGVGGAIGLFLSAAIARRTFTPPRPEWLMWQVALSLIVFGGTIALLGLVKVFPVAIALTGVIALSLYSIFPPYLVLVALISRPEIRSQAYGYTLFFVALGALVYGRIAAVVAERVSLDASVILLGSASLLGGLIGLTIPKFIRGDVEQVSEQRHVGERS